MIKAAGAQYEEAESNQCSLLRTYHTIPLSVIVATAGKLLSVHPGGGHTLRTLCTFISSYTPFPPFFFTSSCHFLHHLLNVYFFPFSFPECQLSFIAFINGF
ncbi:hypothetical protein XENOCAPTIV_001279 [Xenoophorus captivus]|uniref:Uncharacterized protein n=1 Tax=Xenoophorus captivus TaxID=1517983 RepID=A0ABV0RW92_9TELE